MTEGRRDASDTVRTLSSGAASGAAAAGDRYGQQQKVKRGMDSVTDGGREGESANAGTIFCSAALRSRASSSGTARPCGQGQTTLLFSDHELTKVSSLAFITRTAAKPLALLGPHCSYPRDPCSPLETSPPMAEEADELARIVDRNSWVSAAVVFAVWLVSLTCKWWQRDTKKLFVPLVTSLSPLLTAHCSP